MVFVPFCAFRTCCYVSAQARTIFKRKMEAAAREVSELAQRVAVGNGWVTRSVSVDCQQFQLSCVWIGNVCVQ
jgi:hypothetical protein